MAHGGHADGEAGDALLGERGVEDALAAWAKGERARGRLEGDMIRTEFLGEALCANR